MKYYFFLQDLHSAGFTIQVGHKQFVVDPQPIGRDGSAFDAVFTGQNGGRTDTGWHDGRVPG
jgi:hypothetical protein